MFVVSLLITDMSTADSRYVPLPVACRLVKAMSVLDTAMTVADETFTFGDGTTTIGTITVAYSGSAEGDVDDMVWAANVALGPATPLKIAIGGTSTGGAGTLTMMFSEYHAA